MLQWYASNHVLHHHLKIQTIPALASHVYKKVHTNPLISKLSSITLPNNPHRRLKRKWPKDLLKR